MEKVCTKCLVSKSLEDFKKDGRLRDGRSSWCKGCHNQEHSNYKKSPAGRASTARGNFHPNAKTRARTRIVEDRMLRAAGHRAKKRGLDFTLELQDIVIPEICPVLGLPLFRGKGSGGMCENSPTLDRIDPSRGYVRENVWVISWRANRLKSDSTLAELKLLVEALTRKEVSRGA